MIKDNETGLLADFFSPEDFATKAVHVLKDPAAASPAWPGRREADR